MTPLAASAGIRRPPAILGALVTGYVALLPYQFQVAKKINFAPADLAMVLVILLAAGQLKYSKPAWTVWHFGIVIVFIIGSLWQPCGSEYSTAMSS